MVITEVADLLGLTVTPRPEGEGVNASGRLGRIHVDVRPRPDRKTLELQVDLLTRGRLCVRRRTASAAPEKAGPKVATGDAGFDASIEIFGAGLALQERLRDPNDSELRDLIRRVVLEKGAIAMDDDITLVRTFPPNSTALQADLEAMIQLARWLNEPYAPKALHVQAPIVPPFAGPRAQTQRIREFLAGLGSSIAPGRLEPRTDRHEWRGAVLERPLRIFIDDNVIVKVSASIALGNIELRGDPDAVPDAEGPNGGGDLVFVGHGVFVSPADTIGLGSGVVAARLAQWARIPVSERGEISAMMLAWGVAELIIDGDGFEAELRRTIHELLDPARQIEGLSRNLGEIANRLSLALPVADERADFEDGSADGLARSRCTDCGSLFVWDSARRCVNCGAIPSAPSLQSAEEAVTAAPPTS